MLTVTKASMEIHPETFEPVIKFEGMLSLQPKDSLLMQLPMEEQRRLMVNKFYDELEAHLKKNVLQAGFKGTKPNVA